jgi:hypothetical protein
MATRKELIAAVGARYRAAARGERRKILDEFTKLTGFHRKHAIRVLAKAPRERPQKRPRARLYGQPAKEALIMVWEAADRVCGKRLKALIPTLIDAMERHGRVRFEPEVREPLLRMSAASIDRLLQEVREQAGGQRKRRPGVGSAIRRSVRVRTISDWNDPPPGFFETDMVEHCGGPKYDGNFVHTLTLTDIATGWTECFALLVREQSLVVEGFATAQTLLPFALRGLDADNDTAFMNDTVFSFCKEHKIEFTRSRAYKKNDQAWVEQKNGAVVRRLVGYGRLSGATATAALAELYAVARLYINFFQPSFKLKSKSRDGARIIKKYHHPATPCERLLRHPAIDEPRKALLREQLQRLDPVQLLQQIRAAQQRLTELVARDCAPTDALSTPNVDNFLASLAKAWKNGEVRPTHRRKSSGPRLWRTRVDPFELVWPMAQQWLEEDPGVSAKALLGRLTNMLPDLYAGTAQLRTLQRRVQKWRCERATKLLAAANIDNGSRKPTVISPRSESHPEPVQ